MNGINPHSEPELEALLAGGKAIPHVPEVVRARALSRARATMAAMAALPQGVIPGARWRGLTVALAASLALVVGAAVATATLLGRTPSPNQPVPPALPRTERPLHKALLEVPAPSPVAEPQPTAAPKTQRWERPATAQESYAAELDLLARAQVAYVAREFSDALARVAEHGRKFPSGRLAEEREALRVRALEGAGRMEEARRAASAFAGRFPRSIMLSRPSGEPR